MAHRWLFAAVVITASLITGCSSTSTRQVSSPSASASKSTSAATPATGATGTTATSATETAPVAPLDSSQCVDVTGANVDLLAASDKDAARKAADTLESYNPPGSVKDAIEHFVSTGGAHFDDPDYTKNNKVLDGWVKQVCPT